MIKFSYTITDEAGIHARPAGLLVRKVKSFESAVTLECGGKTADAAKLIVVMAMDIKHGDTVSVAVEGADEETAAAELEKFFAENL